MKALKVAKSKVSVEMSIDQLFTIFNSLNAVVEQYEILDFKILNRVKRDVDDVLEEITILLFSITDEKANIIPSRLKV